MKRSIKGVLARLDFTVTPLPEEARAAVEAAAREAQFAVTFFNSEKALAEHVTMRSLQSQLPSVKLNENSVVYALAVEVNGHVVYVFRVFGVGHFGGWPRHLRTLRAVQTIHEAVLAARHALDDAFSSLEALL